MDLRRYLQAIRKFWWVVLIPAVLGVGYGAINVSTAESEYRTSVTFFVKTTGESTVSAAALGDQFAQRRVNSYVALLGSERLAEMVINSTGLELEPDDLSDMITASGDVNTVLLTASVTSSDEATAEQAGEAISTQFPLLVDQVENEGATASVNLEVVSGPTTITLKPRLVMTVGFYGAIGLALGLALALLLELRDNAVRTDDDLRDVSGAPVLGNLPFDRAIRSAPLVLLDAPNSIRAEAFRQLRTNLKFVDAEKRTKVLAVTSSVAGEGKSFTASNLALTVAASNLNVVAIEADLRQPTLADSFGIERSVGLTDVLAERVDLDDVLQPWGTSGLVLLPSGQLPPNPSELLGSESMARLLANLKERFDLVVIDTPPILPVTDGVVIAKQADGVILVARCGKTTRHQLAQAVNSLETVGARLVGTVMNMVPTGRGSAYAAYQASYQADLDPSPDRPQRRPNGSSPPEPAPKVKEPPVAEPVVADRPPARAETRPRPQKRPPQKRPRPQRPGRAQP